MQHTTPTQALAELRPGLTVRVALPSRCHDPYCPCGGTVDRVVDRVRDIGHDHSMQVIYTDGSNSMVSVYATIRHLGDGVWKVDESPLASWGS